MAGGSTTVIDATMCLGGLLQLLLVSRIADYRMRRRFSAEELASDSKYVRQRIRTRRLFVILVQGGIGMAMFVVFGLELLRPVLRSH